MSDHHDHDLASLRAGLAGTSGQEYWRSLEELANTDAFQEYLHREFPERRPSSPTRSGGGSSFG